jgi:hypothetical protein
MALFRVFFLFAALAATPGRTSAQEVDLVKFICTSAGGVHDVILRAESLVMGLSPLPGGCEWLPPETYGTIGETVSHIDTPGHRVARISRVRVQGRAGLSAGLVELLS